MMASASICIENGNKPSTSSRETVGIVVMEPVTAMPDLPADTRKL